MEELPQYEGEKDQLPTTTSQAVVRRASLLRRRFQQCGRLNLILLAVLIYLLGFISSSHPVSERLHAVVGTKPPSSPVQKEHLDRALQIRVFNKLYQRYYPAQVMDEFRERQLNYDALDRLATCIETQTCGPGEQKVILFATDHFAMAHRPERTSGENIWARSTMKAFKQLNYTMLYGWGHMDSLFMYQNLPDMIDIVLWNKNLLNECIARNETNYHELERKNWPFVNGEWQTGKQACMYSKDYPEGVPHWKSFGFHFWSGAATALGNNWTVSPEDISKYDTQGNYYLGYSTEDSCMQLPYIKSEDRDHRALILGKLTEYFDEDQSMFYGQLMPAANTIPERNGEAFTLSSTAGNRDDKLAEPGITTLGKMPTADWQNHLSHSKAMIGIGLPLLSPSPFDALCAGVPFINPVRNWDANDPMNRSLWRTQTDTLKNEQEPYVYHVFKNNATDLAGALARIVANPIDRYIPEERKWENVFARHKKFATTDWQAEAKKYVLEKYGDDEQYEHLYLPER